MANLTSLIGIASALFLRIEEAKTAMTKIEGSDPKSQFMRRDLRFKCVKLGYEACSLAPAVSAEAVAEVAQRPRVAVEEVLLAELAGVEKKLEMEEKKLAAVQQRVETSQKQCAQKAESLRAQRDVSEWAVAEA